MHTLREERNFEILALFWKTSLFTVSLLMLLFPDARKLCCTGHSKQWRSVQLPAHRNLLSFQVPCDIWCIPTGPPNMTKHLAAYDLWHSRVEARSQVGCPRASQMVQGTSTSSWWCLSCWEHIHNGELSDSRICLTICVMLTQKSQVENHFFHTLVYECLFSQAYT